MLIEERIIQKLEEDRWTVETSRLEHLRVPSTLIGLPQSRFDSLLYPEKLTLQRAAVSDRIFYDQALSAIDAADEIHVDDLAAGSERIVGHALAGLGQYETANRHLYQSLQAQFDMGNLLEIVTDIVSMAHVHAMQGEGCKAIKWLGLALSHPSPPPDARLLAELVLSDIREGFSEIEVDEALAQGARLDLESLIEDLLEDHRS